MPEKTETLILLTDYVNHNLALALKSEAKRRGIKTVFARYSWSHLSKELSLRKSISTLIDKKKQIIYTKIELLYDKQVMKAGRAI